MKSIIKSFAVAAVMLALAVSVSAEEAPTDYTQTSDDISFNYGDNTFSITNETNLSSETELTLMLVQGDFTEKSLSQVTADKICYIGQASGVSYSEIFGGLGVKYTDGQFEPGVYTLVTSGYGMEASKVKIFLGSAVDADATISDYMHTFFADKKVEFGTMSQTLKVVEEAAPDNYIYVGVGEFDIETTVTTDKLGFVVQKQTEDKFEKGYRSLSTFKAFENITSLECSLDVGIQINGLAKTTEVVAIPYVITE